MRHSADGGRTWDKARAVTTDGPRAAPDDRGDAATAAPIVAWSDNARGAFDVYVQELVVGTPAVNVSAPRQAHRRRRSRSTHARRFTPRRCSRRSPYRSERTTWRWPGPTTATTSTPAGPGHRGGEGTAPDDWEVFTATRAPRRRVGRARQRQQRRQAGRPSSVDRVRRRRAVARRRVGLEGTQGVGRQPRRSLLPSFTVWRSVAARPACGLRRRRHEPAPASRGRRVR